MLHKPLGFFQSFAAGASDLTHWSDNPVAYMEVPDGQQPVTGMSASKQMFMFVSFRAQTTISFRPFVAYNGTANQFWRSGPRQWITWQDAAGTTIADLQPSPGLNVSLGERGNFMVSLNNGVGGVRQIGGVRHTNTTGWHNGVESVLAATDVNLAFDLARSGAATGAGILGETSAGPGFHHIDIARIAIWQGVAPDIGDSAWRTANLSKFFVEGEGNGQIADPSLSVALLGPPIIDMFGTAAEWIAAVDDSPSGSKWGNFQVVGPPTDAA